MTLTVYTHVPTGLPAVDIDGEPRILARLPTPPETRARFAHFTAAVPTVPRDQWVAIDRRNTLGDDYILNQRSHGSCVGFSSTGATMRCRGLAGQTFQRLSGAFVYSFINGGRDAGANIGDSLEALQKHGTCLESEVGWDQIYPRNIPQEAYKTAKRFVLDEGYRVESYDEAGTAIQLGFILVYPCMVGGSFDNLDNEDVVGHDRGGGNHAIGAEGMYFSQKHGWCLDAFNSWGLNWGRKGRFRTTEKHWDTLDIDAYAVRISRWDPLDPQQPPDAHDAIAQETMRLAEECPPFVEPPSVK